MFENIITDQITQQVSTIISPFQHGFLKGKSTCTNLLEFCSKTIHGFIKGMQTDTIYTDFSKAFDTVNHELLIMKLNFIGFPSDLLHWISSYLCRRLQKVKYNNTLSSSINVYSGEPQGSHLGPLLFLIFINDLPSTIRFSDIILFADDVKLFKKIRNPENAVQLQIDIDSLAMWCEVNGMILNVDKCKMMTFYRGSLMTYSYTIGNNALQRLESFKDLGVIMDPKLRFNLHINFTINKANGVLGFIKRWAKDFNDPYVTVSLFNSIVRPILEYAVVVWCPRYGIYISRLESVQKQFALFALRKFQCYPSVNLPSYSSRLRLIRLPSLESRRMMLNVTFIHKLLNGLISSKYLLSSININVPARMTGNYIFIKFDTAISNYAAFEQ